MANYLAGDPLPAADLNWQSYTPTPTGTMVFGSGATAVGRYKRTGQDVKVRLSITLGSSFTIGDAGVSLPVQPLSTASPAFGMMIAELFDASVSTPYLGTWRRLGTGLAFMYVASTGVITALSATAPFTWAAGDILRCNGFYEAA